MLKIEYTRFFDVQEILGSIKEYFLLKFFHFFWSQKSHLTNFLKGPLTITVTTLESAFTLKKKVKNFKIWKSKYWQIRQQQQLLLFWCVALKQQQGQVRSISAQRKVLDLTELSISLSAK